MTQRLPPKTRVLKRLPRLKKPPANATAEQLHAYALQAERDAATFSRPMGEGIEEWKHRLRRWSRPEGAATADPLKGVRHLYSLKADEGVLANRCTAIARATGQRCKMIAVKGMDVCCFHGGQAELERRRLALGIPPLNARQAARRTRRRLREFIPYELRRHPVYRMLDERPEARAGILQAKLEVAWLAMRAGDFNAWATALRAVKDAGFSN